MSREINDDDEGDNHAGHVVEPEKLFPAFIR